MDNNKPLPQQKNENAPKLTALGFNLEIPDYAVSILLEAASDSKKPNEEE